jgi:hypothetical protein
MPAVSEEQRRLMAIAEHHPGKLYKRNRGVLKMTRGQLHDYASTKGLKRKYVKALRRKKGKKHG